MPVCRFLPCRRAATLIMLGLVAALAAPDPLQAQKRPVAPGAGGALVAAEGIQKLKLSQEQQQRFDKIDQEYQAKQQELEGKLEAARKERDRNKYLEVIEARRKLRPEYLAKLESVLTDPQRSILADLRQPVEPNNAPKKQLRGPDLLQTGDPAPDFTIQDIAGKQTVKLSDLKGKPVVLIFGSCT